MEAQRPQEEVEEDNEEQIIIEPAIPQPIDFSAFNIADKQEEPVERSKVQEEEAKNMKIRNDLDNLEKILK